MGREVGVAVVGLGAVLIRIKRRINSLSYLFKELTGLMGPPGIA